MQRGKNGIPGNAQKLMAKVTRYSTSHARGPPTADICPCANRSRLRNEAAHVENQTKSNQIY